jgi:hypothetical protein
MNNVNGFSVRLAHHRPWAAVCPEATLGFALAITGQSEVGAFHPTAGQAPRAIEGWRTTVPLHSP